MGKDKVAAGVKGKSPKAGMVDPKGAWTKVQERTLAKNGKMIKKAEDGGSLKPVPADKVGLGKLPTKVRNKMDFQKNGGKMSKKK